MMSEDWGPWVEHDGASVRGVLRGGIIVNYQFVPPGIAAPVGDLTLDWPGFLWRWRRVRVGWFRTELRRVCDQPEFAPIIRYRIRKPRGMAILERIVAAPAEKVDA